MMKLAIFSKMNGTPLERQAIKAAINAHWEKAVKINQEILKQQPRNTAALNRLGRAFWEIGKLEAARKTYREVLEIDQYNPIASRNLKRIVDSSKKNKKKPSKKSPLVEGAFLEEPGKTKTVRLVRLTEPKILSELDSGDPVFLEAKKRTVSVTLEDGTYLGSLPEDISQSLIRFLKGGNRYQAFIKAVDRQHLEIFIHEVFRSRRFKNLPSFSPAGTSYIPFLSPEVIHEEKPEMAPTGEEEVADKR